MYCLAPHYAWQVTNLRSLLGKRQIILNLRLKCDAFQILNLPQQYEYRQLGFSRPIGSGDPVNRDIGQRIVMIASLFVERREDVLMITKFALVGVTVLSLIVVITLPMSVAAQDSSGGTGNISIIETDVPTASGDRTLHLYCVGEGGPTVLYETGGPYQDGGASVIAAAGPDIVPMLGVKLCGYDRMGTGTSPAAEGELFTLGDSAADLNTIMAAPETGCPCVILGWLMGGSIATIALAADSANFAGMVLLDPFYQGYLDDFLSLAPAGSEEAQFEGLLAGGAMGEPIDLAVGLRQIQTPAQPAVFPVIVATHGTGEPFPCPCSADYPADKMEALWQTGESNLATALGGSLVVAEGTTYDMIDENLPFVVEQVVGVISAVKNSA
jgi:pimeloyl-ACP methyl ester carboxylesterase